MELRSDGRASDLHSAGGLASLEEHDFEDRVEILWRGMFGGCFSVERSTPDSLASVSILLSDRRRSGNARHFSGG